MNINELRSMVAGLRDEIRSLADLEQITPEQDAELTAKVDAFEARKAELDAAEARQARIDAAKAAGYRRMTGSVLATFLHTPHKTIPHRSDVI